MAAAAKTATQSWEFYYPNRWTKEGTTFRIFPKEEGVYLLFSDQKKAASFLKTMEEVIAQNGEVWTIKKDPKNLTHLIIPFKAERGDKETVRILNAFSDNVTSGKVDNFSYYKFTLKYAL